VNRELNNTHPSTWGMAANDPRYQDHQGTASELADDQTIDEQIDGQSKAPEVSAS